MILSKSLTNEYWMQTCVKECADRFLLVAPYREIATCIIQVMPTKARSMMPKKKKDDSNVKQAVPFFAVSSMENSLHFYVDGLGFEMTHKWMDEGNVRWCWLRRGGAGLMLQDFRRDGGTSWSPDGKLGLGVSIIFICDDALAIYRDATRRGLDASRPFVSNRMWLTSLRDPDGYSVEFESYTDVPEDTLFEDDTTASRSGTSE
jgi:lactoylglutathione lyase